MFDGSKKGFHTFYKVKLWLEFLAQEFLQWGKKVTLNAVQIFTFLSLGALFVYQDLSNIVLKPCNIREGPVK